MQMVFHAIYAVKKTTLVFYEAHDIGIQFFGMFLVNGFPAVFGSEYQMIEYLTVT